MSRDARKLVGLAIVGVFRVLDGKGPSGWLCRA